MSPRFETRVIVGRYVVSVHSGKPVARLALGVCGIRQPVNLTHGWASWRYNGLSGSR
jgi:hypothetical protein